MSEACSSFEGREGNLSRERRRGRRTGMEMRVLQQIPKAILPISKRRHYSRRFGTHVAEIVVGSLLIILSSI